MNSRSQKKNYNLKLWIKPFRYKDMLIVEKIIKKHLQPVTYNVRIGRDKYIRGVPFRTGLSLYDSIKQADRQNFYLRAEFRTATPNMQIKINCFKVSVNADRRTNKGKKLISVDECVNEIQTLLNSRTMF